MSACHVLLATQGDGVGTCEAKRAGCHTLAVTLPCTFRRMRCGPSVAAELAKSLLVRNLPPMSTKLGDLAQPTSVRFGVKCLRTLELPVLAVLYCAALLPLAVTMSSAPHPLAPALSALSSAAGIGSALLSSHEPLFSSSAMGWLDSDGAWELLRSAIIVSAGDTMWAVAGQDDSGDTPVILRPCQDPEKVTDMLYESLRTSLRVPDDSYGPY